MVYYYDPPACDNSKPSVVPPNLPGISNFPGISIKCKIMVGVGCENSQVIFGQSKVDARPDPPRGHSMRGAIYRHPNFDEMWK